METNNVSPTKKDSILKSLAIAGLLAILLVVAWLAIQLVHIFPGAFNSVASLAESVNDNQETIIDINDELEALTVTSNTSLINNSETLDIEWSEVNINGSYVFSYECNDGVAVTHLTPDGDRLYDCDTNYNVGDTNTMKLGIDSEKNRYADVSYTIAFLRTSDTEPYAVGSNTVTVVNASINNQFVEGTNTPTQEDVEAQDTATEVATTEDTTPEVAQEPPVTTPTYTQEFAYTIPVSDPNGYTDLGATFIGVGTISNRTFVTEPVSSEEDGAIQFAVKNFGTKTSQKWTFSMELPNGDTYESAAQAPLKPNERAVLTIGFPAGAPMIHTFALATDETSDRNSRNDSFTQTVGFAQ